MCIGHYTVDMWHLTRPMNHQWQDFQTRKIIVNTSMDTNISQIFIIDLSVASLHMMVVGHILKLNGVELEMA